MSNYPGQIDPLDPSAAVAGEVLADEAVSDDAAHAPHRAKRLRRLKLSLLTSALFRPLSFLVPVITIPLFLRYLGAERYGMYESISALAMWLGLSNLGLGLGLMNRLTECDVRQDRQTARLCTSTLTVALILMTIVLVAVFTIAVWFVPWGTLLRVEDPVAQREATPAVWVAGTLTLLALLTTLPPAIYSGYQETHRNNIWDGISKVAMLLACVAVVLWPGFGTVGVLAASIGVPTVVRLVNTADLFLREKPWLRPSLRLFDWSALRWMGSEGVLLFLLAMSSVLLFQTDKLIIAGSLGAAEVTGYSILGRVFLLGYGVFILVLMPLWPACGEAVRRGDLEWVRKIVRNMSLLGCSMMLVGGIVLLLARGPISHLLFRIAGGEEVPISASLVLGMTATFVARAWVDSRTIIVNASGVLKPQLPFYVGHAVLNLIVSILIVRRYGAAGVAWATFATALVTSVWGYPWLLKRHIWNRSSAVK